MDKEKLISGVVGGIVAGFSIGVGFMIAQRTMGKFITKKEKEEKDSVSDAVKEGVKEGVKEAKIAEDAANFAAMSGGGRNRNPRAATRAAMNRRSSFMGFDGNPQGMSFTGDPLHFGMSPNGGLNSF